MILISFLAGGTISFCAMAIFNGVSYDKGHQDGYQLGYRECLRDEEWSR